MSEVKPLETQKAESGKAHIQPENRTTLHRHSQGGRCGTLGPEDLSLLQSLDFSHCLPHFVRMNRRHSAFTAVIFGAGCLEAWPVHTSSDTENHNLISC